MKKEQLREALKAAIAGWQDALDAHEDGKRDAIEASRSKLRQAYEQAGIPVKPRPTRKAVQAEAQRPGVDSTRETTGRKAETLSAPKPYDPARGTSNDSSGSGEGR